MPRVLRQVAIYERHILENVGFVALISGYASVLEFMVSFERIAEVKTETLDAIARELPFDWPANHLAARVKLELLLDHLKVDGDKKQLILQRFDSSQARRKRAEHRRATEGSHYAATAVELPDHPEELDVLAPLMGPENMDEVLHGGSLAPFDDEEDSFPSGDPCPAPMGKDPVEPRAPKRLGTPDVNYWWRPPGCKFKEGLKLTGGTMSPEATMILPDGHKWGPMEKATYSKSYNVLDPDSTYLDNEGGGKPARISQARAYELVFTWAHDWWRVKGSKERLTLL